MDYKEKYDEAIEALRSFFAEQAIKHCDRVNIKDITNIFPELKESEDERIRKWLINDIKTALHYGIYDGTSIHAAEKALAWLEKQGKKDEEILVNRWKPDELQLQCLSDAIKDYNRRGYEAPILKELLEQLKKLTE